jgi:hypothetical protein
MSHFDTHKTFYNQVLLLTQGQKEQPEEVLQLFLSVYELHTVRELLQSLLQVALTTKHPAFKKAKARDKAYWFCRDLEEVLEAVYLLQQTRTADQRINGMGRIDG